MIAEAGFVIRQAIMITGFVFVMMLVIEYIAIAFSLFIDIQSWVTSNLLVMLHAESKKGTVYSDHTSIKKIDGNSVFAEREGESIQFNNIDVVVVSTGMKSYNPIGNAQDAIHEAYELAKNL